MTGTYAACLHRNQSRSYLNHLVLPGHHDAILRFKRTCPQDRCNFWCQFPWLRNSYSNLVGIINNSEIENFKFRFPENLSKKFRKQFGRLSMKTDRDSWKISHKSLKSTVGRTVGRSDVTFSRQKKIGLYLRIYHATFYLSYQVNKY